MKELYDQIKKQAGKGLIVRVADLKKVSQPDLDGHQSAFQIGDQIEFTLLVRNDNPFDLSNLRFHVHQMSAVTLEENPVKVKVEGLSEGEEKHVATLRGAVVRNPNDVSSPWTNVDSLCRVKITGTIELQPIQFEDIEVETINVTES